MQVAVGNSSVAFSFLEHVVGWRSRGNLVLFNFAYIKQYMHAHQLPLDRNQLSLDRNQLSRDRNQLSRDRNQLSRDKNQLSLDRNQLSRERNQLSLNRNQLSLVIVKKFAIKFSPILIGLN